MGTEEFGGRAKDCVPLWPTMTFPIVFNVIGVQLGPADTCDVVMKVAMIVANTTVDSLRDIFSMWLWKDDLSLLLKFLLNAEF
jgi:hypothetical protein